MAESVLNQQEQKDNQVNDGQHQKNTLKKIIGGILTVIMVALTVYVLNIQSQNYNTLNKSTDLANVAQAHQAANYRAYVKQYKETKVELEETTEKLAQVTKDLDRVSGELATAKSMLTQTQDLLTSAQQENTKLKADIQELEALRNAENVSNIGELENKINSLKKKNVEVTDQLNSVKTEMRAFEADFNNMEEGKSLLVLFQNKLKLVKSRMRYLKQEAYFAKVAAQKERDRIEALTGNNGFLVKDGAQSKGNASKGFAIDVKIVP